MNPVSVARREANRLFYEYEVRRVNRARYRDRTLLVSDHWDGSVQQFYHFYLGYLAPLALWVERTGERRIMVRDCGPMNAWFAALSDAIDMQIIPPGIALHFFAGKRSRSKVLKGLDDPRHFDAVRLRGAAAVLRRLLEVASVDESGQVVIIDRLTSDDFYHSAESETEMSGSERRSVPNLHEVASSLDFRFPVSIIDLAQVPPIDQIRATAGARILVGQHGAGLAHMVWMDPGSTIVEIQPPLPDDAVETFSRLAKALDHRYIRVPQDSVHADVDPKALIEGLQQAGALRPGEQ